MLGWPPDCIMTVVWSIAAETPPGQGGVETYEDGGVKADLHYKS